MPATHRPDSGLLQGLARVEQFFGTLTHRHSDEIDSRIQRLLSNNDQWRLVARLSTFDRAHHLRVHDLLLDWNLDDPDLLRAALLHDVGKANQASRVRLWHRVARVTGRRVSPALWNKLTSRDTDMRRGLYLAEHHASLGAALVYATGASERCCELIANHERERPTGDVELDALIAADEEV